MKNKPLTHLIARSLIGSLSLIVLSIPINAHAAIRSMAKAGDLSKPVPVSVIKPAVKYMAPHVTTIGTLSALRSTWIIPKTDGYISQINFSEGGRVKAGTVLITLDDSQAKAQFTSDQVAYTTAEKQYERQAKLAKKGYVSKEDFDNTASLLASKKAAVAASQQALNDTILKAPFSGYLGAKTINTGEYVQSAQKLLQIVNLDNLKVIYNIPEADLPKLSLGEKIGLTSSEYPGKLFIASVSFIAPEVDSTTGTVEVHALYDNKDHLLEPGEFVSVKQPLAKPERQILIPDSAIVQSLDGSFIFIVKDNKAVKQAVVVGKQLAGSTEIKSGLTPDDLVVVQGQTLLQNGQIVTSTLLNSADFGKSS